MYKKLNLPSLDIKGNWYTDNVQLQSKNVKGYISYYVTPEFDTQIRSMFSTKFFPEKTHIIAQIIDPRLNHCIHKDKRQYAINYLVRKGGLNAHTAVYSEDHNLISTYEQQEGEWYLLNTFMNHAVEDLDSERIAVSISFYEFGEEQWKWLDDKM